MQRNLTFAALLASTLAVALPATAFASARAELRPGTTLAVGAPAQLEITVDGDARPPAAPRVDGADLRFAGQMSETSSINGATTHHTTFSYVLVPSRTGALDIPAITVGADTTAPIHATVTAAPPAAASAPVSGPSRAAAAHAAVSDGSHAFLTLDVPAKSLVVGQAVPIQIHAFFRGGTSATLQGAPHLTSDAFTLSELSDKPAQAQIELRGEPYLEATWTAVLSPAKPSAGQLAVELPVELAYRATPPPRPAAPAAPQAAPDPDDPFSDPFFQNAFGGAGSPFGGGDPFAEMDSLFDVGPMQQQDVTLRATAGHLAVAELPATGQPAGFGGAVGRFDVALAPPQGEPRVGEPLTLAIQVTGTGNFDRVAMSGAPDTEDLHVYPVKAAFAPSSPNAKSALTGTKTFTQTVVPARAGDVVIPALAFAYFDPAKRAYVTASTAPITLHVAAAAGSASSDPGLASAPLAHAPSAATPHVASAATHATLQPMFRARGFWAIPGALFALTALLVGAAWWRRSPRIAHVLRTRRVDRAVARASLAMDRAARSGDPAAFFAAARTALQTRLGAAWHTAPDAITAHDVGARLGESGAQIRAVLERADDIAYGQPATAEPLDHWSTVVRAELAHLEAAS